MAVTKNRADVERRYDKETSYTPSDAVDLVKTLAFASFDESVDAVFRLGIDARQADQIVRGTVSLPHGTGKDVKVLVFANDQAKDAEEAGADVVGGQELADEIAAGRDLDWDVTIATPDMMPVVGKLGQILGPRGLMPNPKSGTVTKDVSSTVSAFKAGRVEYRNDRFGNVHIPIGRVSFDADKLVDNLAEIAGELTRIRPSAAKGTYMKSVSISSTMGPGIKVDTAAIDDLLKADR